MRFLIIILYRYPKALDIDPNQKQQLGNELRGQELSR